MKRKNISLSMPKGFSKSIHASVLALTIFGVFMIVSANATINALDWTILLKIIIKESFFIIISYLIMVLAARRFSFSKLEKYYIPLLVLTFGSLLLTLMFPAVGGAKAWIRLGPVTIQPSEFAKVMVILVMAYSLGDRRNPSLKFSDLATHPLVIVLLIGLIVLMPQSDLGTAAIIMLIALMTYMTFGHKILSRTQGIFLFLFTFFIVALVLSTSTFFVNLIAKLPIPDYMVDRFRVSANPFTDIHNAGAQIFNGMAAFVSGGLFGVGYGKGFLKFSFIFASESDSILAIIVEELGFVFGFMPIVILYGIIIFQLMKYTFLVKSEKDKAILVGTIAYIFIHFLFNVGGVTAFIPLTGVPLLFISAGGSSRMAIMLAIGLSQNVIARHNHSGSAK